MFPFLLGICLQLKFLGHVRTLYEELPDCFLHHFVSLPTVCRISAPYSSLSFFDPGCPNGFEVASHYRFNMHFPNEVEHLFMCLFSIYVSWEKSLVKSFGYGFFLKENLEGTGRMFLDWIHFTWHENQEMFLGIDNKLIGVCSCIPQTPVEFP